MNPSTDVNVGPRAGEVEDGDVGTPARRAAAAVAAAASAITGASPQYSYSSYPYSGRPIIMIGDIAKDLSNLCVRSPPPTPPTRTAASAAAALHAEVVDYDDDEGIDDDEEGGWSPQHRSGSIFPSTKMAAAGARGPVATTATTPNFRYPGSDDFSQNSMSDVSVDEIFNEVPHILVGYGRAAAALAEAEAWSGSPPSSGLSPSRRSGTTEGPAVLKGRSYAGEPSSLPVRQHHDRTRKSSSIDMDRVDDWIVEPVDIAVKARRGSAPTPPGSPLHTVQQFTETTLEETESVAHSQTPSFYDDVPTPTQRRPGIVPRFPSEEILYQTDKRPPPPPPPPLDFTSAYEALAFAGGLGGGGGSDNNNYNNSNNDYSSSTHLQRSAISQPSTLSTSSDWAALGTSRSADFYAHSPSPPARSRRRSSGHSGMLDNDYYVRQPSSFEPSDEPSPLPQGGRRQPVPDHEYHPNLAYDHEELLLLQQSYLPSNPRPQELGFGVPVHDRLSSTLARSPPSPPPPAPPLPQHHRETLPAQRVPSPPPSVHPTPNRDEVVIEVSPGEFLPLRGSDETLKAIEDGLGQQVTCMACGAMLTCIHDCLMVICPDCRCVSQTPNENDHSTIWIRMEDGEPSSSPAMLGNGSGHSSTRGGGGGADWWERGAEEEESEGSFLGGFAARHRQEATRRRANVMAISTRPKHGVGLGLKVADH